MRVLHVIPAIGPHYGGPSAALAGMTRALVRSGVDVTVATTRANGPDHLDVPLDRSHDIDGVTHRFFAHVPVSEWKFSWGLTRWLFANASRFDVLHVHGLFSYSTIPACRAALNAQVPYVLRPLGTLGAWSLSQRSWKKRPYYALVERAHLARAAAVHATSDAEAVQVSALGFADSVRVIPLGVDISPQPANGPSERRTGDPLRVLFMSRLHPGKNVPLLLEACALRVARAPGSVELVIAGDGAPAYRRELEERAHMLGLGDAVRFAGHVSGEEKHTLLRSADLFALTSSHENFGLAAAEALAFGLPCLVSPEVAISADIDDEGAGYVVPLNAEAIAAAMARAEQGSELRTMSVAARRLACERYSWDAAAARLVGLYEEITAPVRLGTRARLRHAGVLP